MSLLAVTAAMMMKRQEISPVLWLNLKGETLVAGRAVQPRLTPGVNRSRTNEGVAYNFTGVRGGILLGDLPALRLGGSITVSAWLNPRSYVNDGPGAELLFRGDDRSGLDPYWMVITSDGTINFSIANENGQGMGVKAELPLNRWTHVTANFDAKTGEMRMWLNGEVVAFAKTSYRPAVNLDLNAAPGVGIGNVQNDAGPHNQPFNGFLADVRLYNVAVGPEEAGFNGGARKTTANPVALAQKEKEPITREIACGTRS